MLSTGRHFPPGTTENQRWAKFIKLIVSKKPVKNYFDMFHYWIRAHQKAVDRRVKRDKFETKYGSSKKRVL